MTNLARLKETMRDIAIEFRELPADRQEKYLERMLVLWEQMMDEHDRIIGAGAKLEGSSPE
jgi:hypothetical protein